MRSTGFGLSDYERRQMEEEWQEAKWRAEREARRRKLAEAIIRQLDEAAASGKKCLDLAPEVGFEGFYEGELPEGETYRVDLTSWRTAASDLRAAAASLSARNPERPTINDVVFNWWPFETAAEMLVQRRSHAGKRRSRGPQDDAGLLAACLKDCEDPPYINTRIERVLEIVHGRALKTPASTLASQGRRRRQERYSDDCPLHPRSPNILAAMQAEAVQYSEEMAL